MNSTRQSLLQQVQLYPALQPHDLLKFLHQSTFGCGHLISSQDAAADYLRSEMQTCRATELPAMESLDGNFCRVNLHYLRELAISPDTFSRLFAFSAAQSHGTTEDLKRRLNIAIQLAEEGTLPFSPAELSAAIDAWHAQGFPAIHHSDTFREIYSPAYRVLTRQHAFWLPLLAAIDRVMESKSPVILAIDGNSGAGKTTLSSLLAQLYDCNLFHMDDFFLRPEQRTPERYATPGENIDHERFYEQVLLPLSRGENVCYSQFDCSTFTLTEPTETACKPLNIVDGCYCMHPQLSPLYDFSVFLHLDSDTQRQRIIQRNGDYAQQFFDRWIPLEEAYFSALDPAGRCDTVIDASHL